MGEVGQLQCPLWGGGGGGRSTAVSAVGGQLHCQLVGGGGGSRSNAVSAVGEGQLQCHL